MKRLLTNDCVLCTSVLYQGDEGGEVRVASISVSQLLHFEMSPPHRFDAHAWQHHKCKEKSPIIVNCRTLHARLDSVEFNLLPLSALICR